ncbi:DNA polymerase III subunit [Acidicapsa ligni]|uniref:DNA polymerase III subunit n=1 Tax=Acidicapsa ligni TaxID=542300 RepID=UPI0021E04F2B|nr:DNA polymerase III subunit delta' [Acidicapsa ligni]
MGFHEFLGNPGTVERLRETVLHQRIPQAIILAGPRGAGKYTLALMYIRLVNCLSPTETDGLPDYCGVCRNCERIGQAADLEAKVVEAVSAREDLRETDKRETRILIQPHPDILIIPPDPPQNLIKIGQVRQVIHNAYYRQPVEARRSFFLFTSSAFMKEAANSLLKVLEEPPPNCTLILLTENPAEMLPTIRSRAMLHRLGGVPVETLEELISKRRPELKGARRALVARMAGGAVGRALGFDVDAYMASRQDALLVLKTALRDPDFSSLFRATETYRGGADGQEKTLNLIRAANSLIQDLLMLVAGSQQLMRNQDITSELTQLAQGVSLEWIDGAARALSEVEKGMRRNLLRSLSIDAMALSLERG